MIKLAIIVGHTAKSQGAVNYLGESEYVFNSRIADKLHKSFKKIDGIQSLVLNRNNGWDHVVEVCKEFKATHSLELHFNAYKKAAYGCEVLIYKYSRNLDQIVMLGDYMTDDLARNFNIKERHIWVLDDDSIADGVKVMSEGRGVNNLRKIHNDARVDNVLLIEPVFGNIKTSESERFFEDENLYVETLVESYRKFYDLKIKHEIEIRKQYYYSKSTGENGTIVFTPVVYTPV